MPEAEGCDMVFVNLFHAPLGVGPGWTALLDQLHRDLLTLAPDYQLDDLATRFGGLCIHIADRFDEAGEYNGAFMDAATALSDAAETVSEHTCELC
ncbi:hypothetical protein [Streptomyces halobius]|uniref:Barstar (barnase inhibitor) domain-containing protein n=1 Tax=Streptomyces halobius TaxID=2879846 RepID=A0ABY4MIE6_9ACTN|nr:hypothetical protein [Streptomyces halobius]UQA97117.1 hypothetical protein K9S39_39310 [Streptomyces halobius]